MVVVTTEGLFPFDVLMLFDLRPVCPRKVGITPETFHTNHLILE